MSDLGAFGPGAQAVSLWRRAVGWSKWLVSLALVGLVLWKTDLSEVGHALAGVDAVYMVAAFLTIPLGVVIGAVRWRWLLAANGVQAGLPFLIGSGCVAAFVRLFLPSTIGGDAIRIYDSWRAGATKSQAVATVAVDRIVGLSVLVLLACGALAFNPTLAAVPTVRWAALAAFVCAGAIVLWLFVIGSSDSAPKRLLNALPGGARRPVARLLEALVSFRGKHGVLVRVLICSLLLQLNVVLFYWLIACGLGLKLTFVHMLVAAPIAIFVMMIPITVNGIGLREGIWIVLLGAYELEAPNAVALSWIELGLFIAFGIIGGIVYAARR